MIAALIAASLAADWIPVGISTSRLRVFVDRTSVHDTGGHRFARIRIGSPGVITGRIVLVYQDEEIDCAARTWRLVGFDARDADNKVVTRSVGPSRGGAMLPAQPGTLGGTVADVVCGV